jgi:AI-2 transport protein TqsA
VSSVASLGFWRDLAIILGLTITGLTVGASLLIPFAMATLLFVLLMAMADRITEIEFGNAHLPRWVAHLVSFFAVGCGVALILLITDSQAGKVAEAVPRYTERFAQITSSVVSLVGAENATRVEKAIIGIDISRVASGTMSGAGAVLSGAFLIVLYIPFMLLERRPMLKKLPLAFGNDEVGAQISTVIGEISVGLRRYVGIKTVASLVTALCSYLVMKPVGLDFAETWGVLAFMLNFIPTIGSIVGVVLPSVVSLVQFESITPFLVIVIGCGLVQFIVGNILEPAITGRTLNLSPLMVVVALTFWSALWGVAGALLSVPITVCMLIVFSHIRGTRPLAILMSGDGRFNTVTDSASETSGTATLACGERLEDQRSEEN